MSEPIKHCILNPSKICDNCGECDRCDLDPSKICDNCGKCLNLDGDDYREIKIDKVLDQNEEEQCTEDSDDKHFDDDTVSYDDYDNDSEKTGDTDDNDDDEECEYIDDVDGLDEILCDKEMYSKNIVEKYPGLLVLKKKK